MLRFQDQIDAWAADRLTIAIQTRVLYTLLSGANTVTIGPTGTIVTQRPVWIDGINYFTPGSSPPVEVPMGPMDDDSYRQLSIKTLTNALPTQYYYNATTTNGTLFFWPTVTQNVDLALYLPQAVGVPTTVNSIMLGPPGYARAFWLQLALDLCTPMNRPVPPLLPDKAAAAYALMKRQNVEPGSLGIDAMLVPTSGGGFNILTGTYTSSSNR